MAKSVAILAVVFLITGCQHQSVGQIDPDRILGMAGEEAGQINAPQERLTRQLNIANRQTENGHATDARKTLAEARSTIEHADKNALTDQQRLAGWISLCELARDADDKPFANSALDQALASLNEITPAQARCEYVLGIEREVKNLRGDAPAAKLLVTASEWAMELPKEPTRRAAYVSFANALFHCSDYDAARTVLRHDADAAWRSDALTFLSDRARWELPKAGSWLNPSATLMSRSSEVASEAAPSDSAGKINSFAAPFGQPLDFKSNFYRQR
jgi:hypothetical protein